MSIFNMALVDFPAFFDKFLPHLLSGTEQLDENQRSILLQGIKQKKNRRKNHFLGKHKKSFCRKTFPPQLYFF